MPRFFFHIHDGENLRDDVGTKCVDWEHAQREAVRVAGDIIADNAKRRKLGETWSMEVTDEKGLVLFLLDFQIAASPAVSNFARK